MEHMSQNDDEMRTFSRNLQRRRIAIGSRERDWSCSCGLGLIPCAQVGHLAIMSAASWPGHNCQLLTAVACQNA